MVMGGRMRRSGGCGSNLWILGGWIVRGVVCRSCRVLRGISAMWMGHKELRMQGPSTAGVTG